MTGTCDGGFGFLLVVVDCKRIIYISSFLVHRNSFTLKFSPLHDENKERMNEYIDGGMDEKENDLINEDLINESFNE